MNWPCPTPLPFGNVVNLGLNGQVLRWLAERLAHPRWAWRNAIRRLKGLSYPSVPEALGVELISFVEVGVGTTVGLSAWPCKARPIATVEIACLKINCS